MRGHRKSIQILKVIYMAASNEGAEYFTLPRQGRPSMVSDEISTEIKAILQNISGGEIT